MSRDRILEAIERDTCVDVALSHRRPPDTRQVRLLCEIEAGGIRGEQLIHHEYTRKYGPDVMAVLARRAARRHVEFIAADTGIPTSEYPVVVLVTPVESYRGKGCRFEAMPGEFGLTFRVSVDGSLSLDVGPASRAPEPAKSAKSVA